MSYNKGDYNDGWEGRTWFCDTDSREYNDGARDRACYDATQKSNRESDGDYGGSYDTDDSGYSEAWIPLTFFGGIALIGFLMLFGGIILDGIHSGHNKLVNSTSRAIDKNVVKPFNEVCYLIDNSPKFVPELNKKHKRGSSIWLALVIYLVVSTLCTIFPRISKNWNKKVLYVITVLWALLLLRVLYLWFAFTIDAWLGDLF